MKSPVYKPLLFVIVAATLFCACGKTKNTIDNINNGGHVDPPSTNNGEVITRAVSAVTSGHATIEVELTKLPGIDASTPVGFVWDTKSHTTITEYPNSYFTPLKQFTGTFSFIRAGLVGGTTYYVRAVAGKTATGGALIYGKELSFTTKPSSMEPGEFMHGGILFYVDGTGKHGLVANLDALVSVFSGPKWTVDNYIGANFTTETAISTGKSNTEIIVSHYGTSATLPYAALACHNLEKNGFTDWFLPSIDELSQLKKNLYDTELGLARGHFWSSSTPSAGNAWCLGTDTSSDFPDLFFISSYASVCAVRSF